MGRIQHRSVRREHGDPPDGALRGAVAGRRGDSGSGALGTADDAGGGTPSDDLGVERHGDPAPRRPVRPPGHRGTGGAVPGCGGGELR